MRAETVMVQKSDAEVVREIVQAARDCMENCNWRLGELAADWVQKTGETDAEFGEWIGYSKKQVQQRRSIWEKFGREERYHHLRAALTWTHFREALAWDDEAAFEALAWAAAADANTAEMRAWYGMKHGKPMATMLTDEREVISDKDTPNDGEKGVVLQRAKAETPETDDDEAGTVTDESRESDAYQPYRKEQIQKEKPPAGGKVKDKCKQPREIDQSRFSVAEEVDNVVVTCRDLAAPFCAAKQTSAFIRALMVVMEELAKVAEAEESD